MKSIEFFGKRYETDDDHMLVMTRAVKAEINLNFDCFPYEELEKAVHTYDGCKLVYVDHTYHKVSALGDTSGDSEFEDGIDRTRSRGRVLASYFEPVEGEIYLLLEISKEWQLLNEAIMSGAINAVSMGCTCTTYCSICGQEFDELNPCPHCPTRIGTYVDGRICYDILRDINFYEISIVPEEASPSACFVKVVG